MNDLSSYERQNQLTRLLGSKGRLTVAQICAQFSVSEATARRDLDSLAEQGKVQRVHGGAVSIHRADPELPILSRAGEQLPQKERIGRAAAALVQEGETIFLGSGTTVLQVAHNLLEKNITVITNSLPIINLMADCPNIGLIALGGMFRESERSFIGHITEAALSELRADRVIMGTRAISVDQGLTNDYLPETLTDRAILHIGRHIIIVADQTKCGVIATAFLAPLTAMHTLVTCQETDPLFIHQLNEQGIRVLVV
jgi:DeoR family transcriptional regulator, aga operon transcriptional repressor